MAIAMKCSVAFALFAAVMVLATPAVAAPEEIQVYMDEMSEPGHFGLDTHLSYVMRGSLAPDYDGAEITAHRARITPEWAYGINRYFEGGMYLPLATIDRTGKFRAEGVKFRLKYIAPHEAHPDLWYGINFEIGRVSHNLDVNPWNAELKTILGTRRGRWTIAGNANFDFVVSGPEKTPVAVDLDLKVSYALSPHFAVGIETYDGIGNFRNFGTFLTNEQSTFATIDTTLGDWDFNVGVGRGYGGNEDKWIVKAIVGIPIERLLRRQR
jgi:hypothetical protein